MHHAPDNDRSCTPRCQKCSKYWHFHHFTCSRLCPCLLRFLILHRTASMDNQALLSKLTTLCFMPKNRPPIHLQTLILTTAACVLLGFREVPYSCLITELLSLIPLASAHALRHHPRHCFSLAFRDRTHTRHREIKLSEFY